MKNSRLRLGPLALLFTVIMVCVATMGMLSLSNAEADLRMAVRYANTVTYRYELEKEGQLYLRDVNEGVTNELSKTVYLDEYRLIIELDKGDSEYYPTVWKLEKIWNREDDVGHLWEGN